MSASSSTPAVQGVQEADTSTTAIFQVGEDGDVILVVGLNKDKIQVHSSFLKHVSLVFRVMMTSAMSEGEALRNKVDDSPVEIMLPEDSARAIRQILQYLYGANPCPAPDSVVMKEIAILANKYDMVSRLRYFAFFWLQHIPVDTTTMPGMESAWNLLVASYLLEVHAPFFNISKKLVASKGSLLKHVKSTHDEVLGLQLGSEFAVNLPWNTYLHTDKASVAIEEVRSAAKSRKLDMGLCLGCLIHATDSFTKRHAQCKHLAWHFP
ncbi:hypothetical protein FHETE_1933 [Fusarium heterosporum]|uniref:BTB domain-containing protein n=1 Tax=Fusarium heterosporum TaxID=42747 RepID=A0A8H5TVN8_FUSHE|nr:hypothetical protein FHETE_1933 [Fusarium heterosporum]